MNVDCLFYQIYKGLDDAFGRTAVPPIRDCGSFPLASNHIGNCSMKFLRIFANKYIRALLHGFNVFGIAVQRSTRNIGKGGFFGNIARIGYNSCCVRQQIAKLQVAQRLHKA